MLRGSCLCGGVRYEVTGPLAGVVHCHCVTCRKAQGAAFATNASVALGDFRFVGGEALLAEYESSPGKRRGFCRRCGSSVVARMDGADHVRIRMGTLDDDPPERPAAHIWVGDRAPWEALSGDLPRFERGAGAVEREGPRA